NVIINTNDDLNLGGFGTHQNPIYQAFDGTEATLYVTARLTAPLDGTRAEVIDIVLNDLDGNDTAPGEGADEYKYYIDLNQFNETSMTTIEIPLTGYDELQAAPNFTNTGNGSLSDFNLFFLGFLTRPGEGLVN